MTIRLGLDGPQTSARRIRISPGNIDFAAGLYGTAHVLEMGRHYEDYVVTGHLPSMPLIPNLNVAHPRAMASCKSRASSITGNVGEVVAAVVAERCWRPNLQSVYHINSSRAHKTPDYIMRFEPTLPSDLLTVMPPNWVPPGFRDWPVESKAGETTGYTRSYTRRALLQIASYWYQRAGFEPAVVGYGLVVSLTYRSQRQITVNVIAPADQAGLQDAVDSLSYEEFVEQLKDSSSLRAMLHHV